MRHILFAISCLPSAATRDHGKFIGDPQPIALTKSPDCAAGTLQYLASGFRSVRELVGNMLE